MTQPAKFDINAAKRIAAATKWVEQQPRHTPGDRRGSPPERPPIWAKITDLFRRIQYHTQPDQILPLLVNGIDSNPIFYSWTALTIDGRTAPHPLPMTPPITGHANAFQVNASPQIHVPCGTIVELHFAGNDNQGEPLYHFTWTNPTPPMSVPPHDHRSNDPYNGGFAFATLHPGTGLPQQPWAI